MGIIDRLAKKRGYIKPEQKARKARVYRAFDGAKADRLTFGFSTSPQHVNADLKKSYGALVARARELAKNDDYVRRYMRVARNNILGPHGIQLQGRVQFTSGARRGEMDTAANEAIETAWKEWGRKGVCEASGRHSWRDVQCMAVDSVMRDGEALVELVRDARHPFGFHLRLIDSVNLPWDYNEKHGRNEVCMGVEVDAMERPVAYHFRSSDSSCKEYYTNGGRGYVRVPATYSDGKPRILHIFRAEEVGQARGFTGLASAIMRLKMLSGYEEATLVAARIGASQMLFFEQGEGAGEYTGDDMSADGAPIDEVEPGVARVLPPGWKAHAFDPSQPTTQYVDFTKQTLRGIAAGLGLSYITLANDLESVNYSSARVGVLEDREEWKGVQAWFVESLCQPIYAVWLEMALITGKIVLPSGAPMPVDRYEKFMRVSWMPRRWDWVDPLKDMQANQLAVDMGVRSVSDIIRERGQDPDEVFLEIQREKQRLKEMGISPVEAVAAPPVEEPEEEEDEEEMRSLPTINVNVHTGDPVFNMRTAVHTPEMRAAFHQEPSQFHFKMDPIPAPVVNVQMPEVSPTPVEVKVNQNFDTKPIVDAVERSGDKVKGAVDNVTGAVDGVKSEVAKPTKAVFDKNGNPVGSKKVDKL